MTLSSIRSNDHAIASYESVPVYERRRHPRARTIIRRPASDIAGSGPTALSLGTDGAARHGPVKARMRALLPDGQGDALIGRLQGKVQETLDWTSAMTGSKNYHAQPGTAAQCPAH